MIAALISVNCQLAVILSRTSHTSGARFPQLLVTAAVILLPHIPVALVSVSCHLVIAYHTSSSIAMFSLLMSSIISYFVFLFFAARSHQLSCHLTSQWCSFLLAVILSPHIPVALISLNCQLQQLSSCHLTSQWRLFPSTASYSSCHLVTSHPSGAVSIRCQLDVILSPHIILHRPLLHFHMSFPCPSFPIACALFTVTCQLSLNAAHKSITFIILSFMLYLSLVTKCRP